MEIIFWAKHTSRCVYWEATLAIPHFHREHLILRVKKTGVVPAVDLRMPLKLRTGTVVETEIK